MKKVTLSLFLILILNIIYAPFADARPLDISAPNAVLVDYLTGEVLYDHNAQVPAFPASTTKVLTTILALENLDLDEVITVDYDIHVIGSSMYLRMGESFTVDELIQALMIRSANDVGELLAIRISGSVEEFSALMNKRAKELGAKNSNFTNPHGLHDDNHVTTAYDLAMITRHALKFDRFREIMNTVNLQFEPTEQTPETRFFRNSNRFLWGTGRANHILYNGRYIDIKYDIVDGVKTGFTNRASNCLISSAVKNDHRLIAVVLGANGANVYTDSRRLLDYGYDNFKLIHLTDKNVGITEINVLNSKLEATSLYSQSNLFAIVPINADESLITKQLSLQDNIKAPIEAGTVLGTVQYVYNDNVLGSVSLINNAPIEARPVIYKVFTLRNSLILLGSLFILWQILVIYLRLSKKKIRRSSSRGYSSSYKFSKNLLK